jgi:hypothetical protein
MIRILVALSAAILAFAPACLAQNAPPDAVKELAPTGKLRAAINYGNGVLAQQGADGTPQGVSADLSRELAKRLGVPLEFVPFPAAGKAFEAAKKNAIDVLYVAIEPVRAAEVEFTPPYVLIEGAYMVPKDSALQTPADVDKPGIRIAIRRELCLRPLSLAHAAPRQADAHGGRMLQEHRTVPRREVRGRGRRAPAARRLRQGPSRRARDGAAVPADPSGNGDAEGPPGWLGVPAHVHRGDEGERLRRRGAQEKQPTGRAGRARRRMNVRTR